jgi:1-deoxy-D-xylulose-5-phosphate synthase
MLWLALAQPGPVSMRYPKASLEAVARPEGRSTPVAIGKAEVLDWGHDGCFIVFGTLLANCVAAAKLLKAEGLHVGVINARFAKPIDRETILKAVDTLPAVVTVEEGTLEGGFGSAVLEACNAAGVDARHVARCGIPDRFIEHGDRNELLSDLGLDAQGLADSMRRKIKAAADTDDSGTYDKLEMRDPHS